MTPQLSPELQSRLVKLVRDFARDDDNQNALVKHDRLKIEARELAALLPPEPDPDRVKAEEIAKRLHWSAKGCIDALYEAIQHGRAAEREG